VRGVGELVYRAKTQRGILGLFLFITVTSISKKDFSNAWIYLQIGVIVFILLSFFMEFSFKIDEGFLIYQLLFMAIPIFQKVVSPNQIIRMKFIRVGWMSKGAIIQVKNGFNIRVIHFSPDDILVNLIDFANKNNIPISKTKDYRILEK
jgi:hypothetical protein